MEHSTRDSAVTWGRERRQGTRTAGHASPPHMPLFLPPPYVNGKSGRLHRHHHPLEARALPLREPRPTLGQAVASSHTALAPPVPLWSLVDTTLIRATSPRPQRSRGPGPTHLQWGVHAALHMLRTGTLPHRRTSQPTGRCTPMLAGQG